MNVSLTLWIYRIGVWLTRSLSRRLSNEELFKDRWELLAQLNANNHEIAEVLKMDFAEWKKKAVLADGSNLN